MYPVYNTTDANVEHISTWSPHHLTIDQSQATLKVHYALEHACLTRGKSTYGSWQTVNLQVISKKVSELEFHHPCPLCRTINMDIWFRECTTLRHNMAQLWYFSSRRTVSGTSGVANLGALEPCTCTSYDRLLYTFPCLSHILFSLDDLEISGTAIKFVDLCGPKPAHIQPGLQDGPFSNSLVPAIQTKAIQTGRWPPGVRPVYWVQAGWDDLGLVELQYNNV